VFQAPLLSDWTHDFQAEKRTSSNKHYQILKTDEAQFPKFPFFRGNKIEIKNTTSKVQLKIGDSIINYYTQIRRNGDRNVHFITITKTNLNMNTEDHQIPKLP